MAPSLADQSSFPKFISNVPVGEDLFAGKSQEKVAKIIAETILRNDQMQVIGIDGGWGTGKSNLIEIIRVNLSIPENEKFHFFIYDAWAHQEDLQRRSFLEELTDYLTKTGVEGGSIIKHPEKWNGKLKQLLSKARETQTKTVPSLSLGIVISALAVITTPIFKAVSDGFKPYGLKVLVTAIPLLAVLSIFLYHFFRKRRDSDNWLKHLKGVAARLFQIYQENQIENTTFETISEDEPSVRKFRRWMDEISTDLNGSKLVIVFDNMDRLPGAKVLQLWSSIHTFFAESRYDNIKVLIPFDRQNINEAFKSSLPEKKLMQMIISIKPSM